MTTATTAVGGVGGTTAIGGLRRAVRAELLKFFTTRMWWGMATGVVLSAAGFALLFAILYTDEGLMKDAGSGGAFGGIPTGDATQIANSVYTAGIGVGYLLMLVIGVVQIGSEYRHQTITSTFLAIPHRARVMGAKVVALVVIGAAYGLLSLVGSVAVGALTLRLRGGDPFPSADVLRTIALSLLVLGLWSLIGLGIGILIRNQVAALMIGVGAAWIVEPLLGAVIQAWGFGRHHIAPYLPSQATQAVINVTQASADDVRLSWWAGGLALLAWALAFAVAGILRTLRQDIG